MSLFCLVLSQIDQKHQDKMKLELFIVFHARGTGNKL
jgi:hypothetical protein